MDGKIKGDGKILVAKKRGQVFGLLTPVLKEMGEGAMKVFRIMGLDSRGLFRIFIWAEIR